MAALAMYQAKQEKLVMLKMSFTIEYIICVINMFYSNVGQTFSLLSICQLFYTYPTSTLK